MPAQGACKANAHLSKSPPSWALAVLVIVGAGGAWLGRTYILNAPDSGMYHGAARADLELWAVLIGAFVGYALASCLVSFQWLRKVLTLFQPRVKWHTRIRWAVVIAVMLLVVGGLTGLFTRGGLGASMGDPHQHQVTVVTFFGMIAALPGLLGFLAVRSLAVSDEQWTEPPECQIALLNRLRQELRLFGLFLTLIVVTTAARRRAVLALHPATVFPPEFVVLYGLVFAGLLALFHGAASMAIDGRCERLLASFAPVPSPDASDFDTRLKRRQDIGGLLGIGSGWQQSFQNGVVVFAPLLTALIGTALPGK
jgi:hypothetical protein